METAPRDRPHRHTVLREFTRDSRQDAETVLRALPGTRYDDLVIVQGDWWYRAEYAVTPIDGSSRVHLTIVNVARGAHWTARIAGRRELADAERAFAALIDTI